MPSGNSYALSYGSTCVVNIVNMTIVRTLDSVSVVTRPLTIANHYCDDIPLFNLSHFLPGGL